MSAHTAGPWYAHHNHYTGRLEVVKDIGDRAHEVAFCANWSEETYANARLIAAAPELLEALQNWLGSPGDPKAGWQGADGSRELYACPYCNAKHGDCAQIPHSATCPIPPARAAIAKAEGTSA